MTHYQQCDPRWAKIDYSAKGEKTDICESGCGPTALAIALEKITGKTITPPELAKWSLKNGYKAPRQGTYYSFFKPCAKAYGVNCYQVNFNNLRTRPDPTSHQKALNALKQGHLVIACMGRGLWTRSGHYILLYKLEGNNIHISDPASTKPNRTKNTIQTVQSQVKYYWIVERRQKMTQKEPWYEKAMQECKKAKLMDGTRPNDPITRAEVAQIFYNAGIPQNINKNNQNQ